MSRTARVERSTSESTISLAIDLDGTGESHIDTGVPFYDHMLTGTVRQARSGQRRNHSRHRRR